MILDRISRNGQIDARYTHPVRKRKHTRRASADATYPRGLFEGSIPYLAK